MLAKIDIQSAFRLLPVHPEDHYLLTMSWKGEVCFAHCISFSLQSAPKLFNILANLLSWAAQKAGVSYLIHYLDDYLTIGPPLSQVCQCNVDIFTSLCKDLGVFLATDKLEGPAISLFFLDIILDTCRMEIRLPVDKLSRPQEIIKAWLLRTKATKREIFTGSHIMTCYQSSKARQQNFCFTYVLDRCTTQKLHFITIRLNKAFRSDLFRWHIF